MTAFHVRLGFTIDAQEPGDAVQDVVDLFTEKGFRDWIYVVDDTQRIVGYFNGWGDQVDAETVERAAAVASAQNESTAPVLDDEGAEPENDSAEEDGTSGRDLDSYTADQDRDSYTDDDDLEALAESLNQQQQ